MAGTETDEVYTSELPRLTDVITKTVSPVCLSSEKAADGSESLVDGIGLDVTTAHKLYMILANLDPTIKLAIFPTTISPEDSKTRVKAWEHVLSSAQVRAGLIQFSASVLTVEEAETDGEKTQKNLLDKATHFFNEQAKPVEKEPSPTPTPSSSIEELLNKDVINGKRLSLPAIKRLLESAEFKAIEEVIKEDGWEDAAQEIMGLMLTPNGIQLLNAFRCSLAKKNTAAINKADLKVPERVRVETVMQALYLAVHVQGQKARDLFLEQNHMDTGPRRSNQESEAAITMDFILGDIEKYFDKELYRFSPHSQMVNTEKTLEQLGPLLEDCLQVLCAHLHGVLGPMVGDKLGTTAVNLLRKISSFSNQAKAYPGGAPAIVRELIIPTVKQDFTTAIVNKIAKPWTESSTIQPLANLLNVSSITEKDHARIYKYQHTVSALESLQSKQINTYDMSSQELQSEAFGATMFHATKIEKSEKIEKTPVKDHHERGDRRQNRRKQNQRSISRGGGARQYKDRQNQRDRSPIQSGSRRNESSRSHERRRGRSRSPERRRGRSHSPERRRGRSRSPERRRGSERDQRQDKKPEFLTGKKLQEMYEDFTEKCRGKRACALADLASCNRPSCRLCNMGHTNSGLSSKDKISFLHKIKDNVKKNHFPDPNRMPNNLRREVEKMIK